MVADALSRLPTHVGETILATLSSPTVPLFSTLKEFFLANPAGTKLLSKLHTDPNMQQQFSYRAPLVYFKERLFIPKDSGLIPPLLEEFHSSLLGGHSGVKATLARLSTSFYWPGMHTDVKQFVRVCAVCQYNKNNTHCPYGLLQPLPIPSQVWEEISMDFIINLPSSANKTVIWVVVDRLTKFAHFVALPTSFTTASLASMFLTEIYRLHGAPKTIVSDRDKVFLSKFWKELFKAFGTHLAFSSSYHPQTDGHTEVLNLAAWKPTCTALSVRNPTIGLGFWP